MVKGSEQSMCPSLVEMSIAGVLCVQLEAKLAAKFARAESCLIRRRPGIGKAGLKVLGVSPDSRTRAFFE